MEYLSKLFGSPARVKLLRLFTFNPEKVYDRDMAVSLARITPDTASKELASLARAGVISRKTYFKEVVRPGSTIPKKRKTVGWMINSKYPHLKTLTTFLRDSMTVSVPDMQKRFRGMGAIKLLVLSGTFVGEREGVVDILVVGERLKENLITGMIHSLEAEYGKELRYVILTTQEYDYRMRVRDKLIREVLDFKHIEIIHKFLGD